MAPASVSRGSSIGSLARLIMRMMLITCTTLKGLFECGWEDCCMKYKNCHADALEGEELLHFIQQYKIRARIKREMLYSVQDLIKAFCYIPYP